MNETPKAEYKLQVRTRDSPFPHSIHKKGPPDSLEYDDKHLKTALKVALLK